MQRDIRQMLRFSFFEPSRDNYEESTKTKYVASTDLVTVEEAPARKCNTWGALDFTWLTLKQMQIHHLANLMYVQFHILGIDVI